MPFGTSTRLSRADCFDIRISDLKIKHDYELKYLGIIMDEKLSWTLMSNIL